MASSNFSDKRKSVKDFGYEPKRKIVSVKYLIVHRNTVARDIVSLARWFFQNIQSSCPYHYFIKKDGTIEWGVDHKIATPGAIKANLYSIQVALDHDCRETPLPEVMKDALIVLLQDLKKKFPSAEIASHTSNKEWTTDVNKKCPGDLLDMKDLKNAVG